MGVRRRQVFVETGVGIRLPIALQRMLVLAAFQLVLLVLGGEEHLGGLGFWNGHGHVSS